MFCATTLAQRRAGVWIPAAKPPGYSPGNSLPGMANSVEFIETVTNLPLVDQPGTVFEYGISFDVLAAAAEKGTGETLGGYLTEAR